MIIKEFGRINFSKFLSTVQSYICKINIVKFTTGWSIYSFLSLKQYLYEVCMLTGDSPGDYKDLKPNNPDIRVEDGTLMINNIQKTNEGYYLCEAVNGIGSGLSAVIMISVQG